MKDRSSMQYNSRKNNSKNQPQPSFQPRFLLLTAALLLLLTAVFFIGSRLLPKVISETTAQPQTDPSIVATTSVPVISATPKPTEPSEIRVTLTGVGDIILHQGSHRRRLDKSRREAGCFMTTHRFFNMLNRYLMLRLWRWLIMREH